MVRSCRGRPPPPLSGRAKLDNGFFPACVRKSASAERTPCEAVCDASRNGVLRFARMTPCFVMRIGMRPKDVGNGGIAED